MTIWQNTCTVFGTQCTLSIAVFIFYWNFLLLFFSLCLVQVFVTQWTAACQASLSFTVSWSLLKLMAIESVMPSNHLILCHPFSSSPQSFPGSGSFPVSQLFTSGGQNIGALASSVVRMNIQGWFPLQLISLLSRGLSRVFSSTTVRKHQFFCAQAFLWFPRCNRCKVCSEELGLTKIGLTFVPGSWEETFKPLEFPKWWECLCYSWWAP